MYCLLRALALVTLLYVPGSLTQEPQYGAVVGTDINPEDRNRAASFLMRHYHGRISDGEWTKQRRFMVPAGRFFAQKTIQEVPDDLPTSPSAKKLRSRTLIGSTSPASLRDTANELSLSPPAKKLRTDTSIVSPAPASLREMGNQLSLHLLQIDNAMVFFPRVLWFQDLPVLWPRK